MALYFFDFRDDIASKVHTMGNTVFLLRKNR